jgi:hypothetical protein
MDGFYSLLPNANLYLKSCKANTVSRYSMSILASKDLNGNDKFAKKNAVHVCMQNLVKFLNFKICLFIQ